MSEITFIGMGLMGAGLAKMAQGARKTITVWNRTPEKMQPLIQDGANGTTSLLDAISASPVVLVCVDNYSVTRQIFHQDEALDALYGKILVQMSTGTPKEAEESEQWFTEHGVKYIDGAVLAGPDTLNSEHGRVIFAGPEDCYRVAEPVLQSLATNARYVGEKIRSASSLDLAWLCRHYGMFVGVSHGAALCSAEGVSLDLYADVFPESDDAHDYVMAIHLDDLKQPTATLRTWGEAFNQIKKHAHDAEIDSGFPDFVSGLFDRAIKAGYGELDVAALAKVLK